MLSTRGMTIAAAAVSFFMAGCSTPMATGETAKVHCTAVNSCKGTSDCKSASNSCKRQNSCKGQGWKEVSKDECVKAGGKVLLAARTPLVPPRRWIDIQPASCGKS